MLGGGFGKAGGAEAFGFCDAGHGLDHGVVDADVFEFNGGDEDTPVLLMLAFNAWFSVPEW